MLQYHFQKILTVTENVRTFFFSGYYAENVAENKQVLYNKMDIKSTLLFKILFLDNSSFLHFLIHIP